MEREISDYLIETINKGIREVEDEVIEDAKIVLERRIRERLAGMTLEIGDYIEYKTYEKNITIKLKLEDLRKDIKSKLTPKQK